MCRKRRTRAICPRDHRRILPDSTTVSDDREITATGGSIPIDPNRQFERIEDLIGFQGTPPERIEIKDPDELRDFDRRRSMLKVYLGFPAAEFTVSAYAWEDRVVVNSSIGATGTEVTLAHEFHHVLFYQRNVSLYGDPENRTSEEQFLARAVAEGAADYVQRHYWREYVKPEGENPTVETRAVYRNGSPTRRELRAPYYFGERYVNYRVDSPRNLTAMYEDPPRTVEELIHLLPPGSEPPTPLSVAAETAGAWKQRTDPDTRGELFVRHALEVGVDGEAAARGADGWGNDWLLAFANPSHDSNGFVWVLRFDDAANASEFETVFDEYLANRGERRGPVWIAERSGGGTVAFNVANVVEETVAVVLSFLVAAPAVAGFVAVSRVGLVVALVVVAGFAVQLAIGLFYTYIVEVVSPAVRVTAVSMLTSVGLLGAFLAPIAGGEIIARAGYWPAFLLAAAVSAVGVAIAWYAPDAR